MALNTFLTSFLFSGVLAAVVPSAHWTTWSCKENPGRTCMFENILYNPKINNFQAIIPEGTSANIPRVKRTAKFDYDWVPAHLQFKGTDERDAILAKVEEEISSPVVFGSLLWHHNAGHFLYDGLYAQYNAALCFLDPDEDFLLLTVRVGCGPDANGVFSPTCQQPEDLGSLFAGKLGMVNWEHMVKRHKDLVLLRKLIVGSEFFGIHSYGPKNIRLYESVPNAIHHFRDRFYKRMGLTIPPPFERDSKKVVNAIIVDNKRFTAGERQMFLDVATQLSKDSTLYLNISFISWPKVGRGVFHDHIKLLSETAIYMSGPGTGLVLHPFMPDGSVLVNVGGLDPMYPECDHPECRNPDFMEENIVASAWRYQRAVYYDSRIRYRGLEGPEIERLLRLARSYVGRPASEEANKIDGRDPGWTNLPIEGKLLEDMCNTPENPCVNLYAGINNLKHDGWPCVVSGWIEQAVYESMFMAEEPIIQDGVPKTCPHVPHALLREWRNKSPYSTLLARPQAKPKKT